MTGKNIWGKQQTDKTHLGKRASDLEVKIAPLYSSAYIPCAQYKPHSYYLNEKTCTNKKVKFLAL